MMYISVRKKAFFLKIIRTPEAPSTVHILSEMSFANYEIWYYWYIC